VAELDAEDTDSYYTVTCSANVNLLGLSGEVLSDSFGEWLDQAKQDGVQEGEGE
jgi:hypothetical protein